MNLNWWVHFVNSYNLYNHSQILLVLNFISPYRLTGGSTGRSAAQKQYYRKFKRLKKVIKDLIFVSAYILCWCIWIKLDVDCP